MQKLRRRQAESKHGASSPTASDPSSNWQHSANNTSEGDSSTGIAAAAAATTTPSPTSSSSAYVYSKSFAGKRKRTKPNSVRLYSIAHQIKTTIFQILFRSSNHNHNRNHNHNKNNNNKWYTSKNLIVYLKRRLLLIMSLFGLACITPNPLSHLLFGLNPIHGGLLGKFMDHQRKLDHWEHTISHMNDALQPYQVTLPNNQQDNSASSGKSLNVPQAVMREMLLRAFRRKDSIRQWYQSSELYWTSCRRHEEQHDFFMRDATLRKQENETQLLLHKDVGDGFVDSWNGRIPPLVVRPNHPTYHGPLYHTNDNNNMEEYSIVVFEDWEREAFLKQLVELMGRTWSGRQDGDGVMKTILDVMRSKRQRREFWIIAFLYQRGGVYLGQGVHHMETSVYEKVKTMKRGDLCDEPVGVISTSKGSGFDTLAISPGHGFLKCLLDKFATAVLNSDGRNVSIFTGLERASQIHNMESSGPVGLPQTCPDDFPLEFFQDNTIAEDHGLFGKDIPVKDISVSITFDAQNENMTPLENKKSLWNDLSRPWFCGRISTWGCHRCLKNASFGSYNNCKEYCGDCLDPIFQKETATMKKRQIDVKVDVNGFKIDKEKSAERMIPRIIHQTWFEEINPMKYPQLFRLQNSWKASGWSYRFYSDDDARSYIVDNFPPQFVEAYDSLIPGAYKADLFRYLVLMKDGGVYADVDVLLDGSLDSFITPTMSFFAPRDAVGEYAQGPYCLWNGLLGSAPGHPFIVRAVERLVNLILDRSDLLDFEREIALKSGRDTELWKVRVLPELMLSGPCALGVSVNEVLEKSPVTNIDVGWMANTSEVYNPLELGDVLILMQDKHDMGAMRFTDVERNILVASTDMPGLSKKPLSPKGYFRTPETKAHYSDAVSGWKGFHIWGTNDVYIDSLVSNELVKINHDVF